MHTRALDERTKLTTLLELRQRHTGNERSHCRQRTCGNVHGCTRTARYDPTPAVATTKNNSTPQRLQRHEKTEVIWIRAQSAPYNSRVSPHNLKKQSGEKPQWCSHHILTLGQGTPTLRSKPPFFRNIYFKTTNRKKKKSTN